MASCPKEIGKRDRMDIAEARNQHQSILAKLMCGPGDSDGAMHRAERAFGLPYWSQWNLRHKRRASPSFVERVRQAYLSSLERSVKRDIEALKTEQARGSDDAALVCLVAEAEALLAKIRERVK